jgi:hypothetical protein
MVAPADPSYRDSTAFARWKPLAAMAAASAMAAAPTEAATKAAAAETATKATAAEAAEAVAAAEAGRAAPEATGASTEPTGASTEVAGASTEAAATLVTSAEPAKAAVGTVIGRSLRDTRWSLGTGHARRRGSFRCLHTGHPRGVRSPHPRHSRRLGRLHAWTRRRVRGRHVPRSLGRVRGRRADVYRRLRADDLLRGLRRGHVDWRRG